MIKKVETAEEWAREVMGWKPETSSKSPGKTSPQIPSETPGTPLSASVSLSDTLSALKNSITAKKNCKDGG